MNNRDRFYTSKNQDDHASPIVDIDMNEKFTFKETNGKDKLSKPLTISNTNAELKTIPVKYRNSQNKNENIINLVNFDKGHGKKAESMMRKSYNPFINER